MEINHCQGSSFKALIPHYASLLQFPATCQHPSAGDYALNERAIKGQTVPKPKSINSINLL